MSHRVIDASVAIKWVVDERHTEEAVKLLDPSHPIHAPELLHIEIDNYCARQVKSGKLLENEANAHRRLIRTAPLQIHSYAPNADSAFEISSLLRHSIYDCVYLALAVSIDGQMVTADRRFYDLASTAFDDHLLWIADV
jgi:predicted nucleic acid-binding protein